MSERDNKAFIIKQLSDELLPKLDLEQLTEVQNKVNRLIANAKIESLIPPKS